MILSTILVIAFLVSASARATDIQIGIFPPSHTTSLIRDILLESEIIGDVLDDFEPSFAVDLAYPKAGEAVLLGNDIPVKATSKRPTFLFHSLTPTPTEKNTTFTLVMTDPDATSRADPVKSEMCHWVLTNLTLPISEHSVSTTINIDRSFSKVFKKKQEGELMSYYPPAPPPATGKHRYVFVLLKGNSKQVQSPEERPHWGFGRIRHGVRDWASSNNLTVVGANFFYAANKIQ